MTKPHQLYYYCLPLGKTDFAIMVEIPTWLAAYAAVQEGSATPLDVFIVENEPAGREAEEKFRAELQDLLDYIFYLGGAPTLRGSWLKSMADLYRPIHNADLLLAQDEFSALIASIRDNLYREDAHWLAEWEYYDATHVMNDSERASARLQSYQTWYKKISDSLVAKR